MANPPSKTTQLFGFHDLVLQEADFRVGMGVDPVAPDVPVQDAVPSRFYAVTVPTKGGAVKVMDYENTPEGHRQLMNLIRGERVIKILFGREIKVMSASVVDLELDGTTITDRLPSLE